MRSSKVTKYWDWIAPISIGFAAILLCAFGGIQGGPTQSLALAKSGFGFNSPDISGFPTGAVDLTGGGTYAPGTAFLQSGGHFRCTQSIDQGPLNGCLEGQGVRWDSAALMASTTFKCTGAANEALKTATTGRNTVTLVADFYRRGDGNEESFVAKMIVSDHDLAPDIAGVQNVWIQGVGCGSAAVNFN
jgi:hypothetical protein